MSTRATLEHAASPAPPGVPVLRSARLRGLPGVVHAFTTRAGGVSTGARSSLDLALRPGEEPSVVRRNWARLVDALDPRLSVGDLALAHQVHGAEVLTVDRPSGPLDVVGEGDGLVTRAAGVVLAIRTADCVPVLLAAPGAVGAAHSGWRGTAQGVVPATVRALCELSGAPPSDLVAAVGPCISGAAYEVGDEVVDGLRAAGLDDRDFLHDGAGSRPHVDLARAVAAQLRRSGVGAVDVLDLCTVRDRRFFSHRRDGPTTGRLGAVIARCP